MLFAMKRDRGSFCYLSPLLLFICLTVISIYSVQTFILQKPHVHQFTSIHSYRTGVTVVPEVDVSSTQKTNAFPPSRTGQYFAARVYHMSPKCAFLYTLPSLEPVVLHLIRLGRKNVQRVDEVLSLNQILTIQIVRHATIDENTSTENSRKHHLAECKLIDFDGERTLSISQSTNNRDGRLLEALKMFSNGQQDNKAEKNSITLPTVDKKKRLDVSYDVREWAGFQNDIEASNGNLCLGLVQRLAQRSAIFSVYGQPENLVIVHISRSLANLTGREHITRICEVLNVGQVALLTLNRMPFTKDSPEARYPQARVIRLSPEIAPRPSIGQRLKGRVTKSSRHFAFLSLPKHQSGFLHVSKLEEALRHKQIVAPLNLNELLPLGTELEVEVCENLDGHRFQEVEGGALGRRETVTLPEDSQFLKRLISTRNSNSDSIKQHGQQYQSSSIFSRENQPHDSIHPDKIQNTESQKYISLPLGQATTCFELAQKLMIPVQKLINHLFLVQGLLVAEQSAVTRAAAVNAATTFGFKVMETEEDEDAEVRDFIKEEEKESIQKLERESVNEQFLLSRPPLISVVGHVDHGKTTLLDKLRKTSDVDKEIGGITQRIRSSPVQFENGLKVCFLDLPGHHAFTDVHQKCAELADLAVLVVSAVEGVESETLRHAQLLINTNVPIVIAISKIDLLDSNDSRTMDDAVKKVLEDLRSKTGIASEELGGNISTVRLSSKTGVGLDELLEKLKFETDLMDLQTSNKGPAKGFVLESSYTNTSGPQSTLMARQGTLKTGDVILSDEAFGKIKKMTNHLGKTVSTADPYMPVTVTGLSDLPSPGAPFEVAASGEIAMRASEVREKRRVLSNQESHAYSSSPRGIGEDYQKTINISVKADCWTTANAIYKVLEDIKIDNMPFKVVVRPPSVGMAKKEDIITVAPASKDDAGILIAFNVKVLPQAMEIAKQLDVPIVREDVIYSVLENVEKIIREIHYKNPNAAHGIARVKKVFTLADGVHVAGCIVEHGSIDIRCVASIFRGGKPVSQLEKVRSLKVKKEEKEEVQTGLECGICLENAKDFQIGDIIKAFRIV